MMLLKTEIFRMSQTKFQSSAEKTVKPNNASENFDSQIYPFLFYFYFF